MPTTLPTNALRLTAAAALVFAATLPAQAQNIAKLKQMRGATTELNITLVPQTGNNGDQSSVQRA